MLVFFWSPDHHQTPLSFEDLDFQPSWGLQEVGKVMGRVQGHPPWKIWFLQAMLILRRPDPQGKIGRAWQWNVILMWFTYGYGSIPMKNTIFRGMNIHKSQLFWCTGVQGFDTLPYIYIHFKPLTTICNILSSTIINHHQPSWFTIIHQHFLNDLVRVRIRPLTGRRLLLQEHWLTGFG